MSTHFEAFYAKLADTENPDIADIVSMQIEYRVVATDGSGLVGSRTETVTFPELAATMSDDVLAAVKAAVDAEVAARAG